jgi:flagellum-specific ATP synthase
MLADVDFVRRQIERICSAELIATRGRLTRVMPTFVEADGPHAAVGTVCRIDCQGRSPIEAEIVSIDEQRVVLMPYDSIHGLMVGDTVRALQRSARVGVGTGFLGRVVNAVGAPLDGGAPVVTQADRPLHGHPISPLAREGASCPLETGVRAIDALLTVGRGQRIGIFAGSGVGKTTLLNCMARNVAADIRVVCLVGERGREAEEFWNHVLTDEQRASSVLVVSTSNEPAIVRARAVHYAQALAEHFRDQGAHVLFVLDSMTRLAMALREIGLAVGEPPTVRAYTPSVFAVMPQVIERFGALRGAGAITALVSVLTESDDADDPLAETLKALLDGHIVLSRELAEQGQLPAIDVQRSVSRYFRTVVDADAQALAGEVVGQLATYASSRSLVESGMYKPGMNARLDRALACREGLLALLRQPTGEHVPRTRALQALTEVLSTSGKNG